MKFNDGAEVYAADGKHLGDVERVVVNPRMWEVTDIVVHKGHVFSTDKVVPIEDVQQTLEDRVTLHLGADPKNYPDYEKTEYIPLVGSEAAEQAPLLWYPAYRSPLYPPGAMPEPYLERRTYNIPVDTHGLSIGAKVLTSEGKHAGHVKEVFTSSSTHAVSHMLISKGMLLPREKLVPVHWIKSIQDDEVHLVVGEELLKSLPDYNQHS